MIEGTALLTTASLTFGKLSPIRVKCTTAQITAVAKPTNIDMRMTVAAKRPSPSKPNSKADINKWTDRAGCSGL